MPSAFDALLSTIVSRATSEIAGAVRDNMADEVLRAVKARRHQVRLVLERLRQRRGSAASCGSHGCRPCQRSHG